MLEPEMGLEIVNVVGIDIVNDTESHVNKLCVLSYKLTVNV